MLPNSQSGQGIIVVLIVLAIMAIGGTYFAEKSLAAYKFQKTIELKTDLHDLDSYLRKFVDCPSSFPSRPVACGSTYPFVGLTDKSGGTLIATASSSNLEAVTQVGRYWLRVSCQPCPSCTSGFNLRIDVSTKKEGQGFRNPLTNKDQNWIDLTKGKPEICAVP